MPQPIPDKEAHPLDELEQQEQEELAEKQGKRKFFNPFRHTYQDGEGVSKEEKEIFEDPTLANFFKMVGRKLNQILSVNLMIVIGNFPVFFALFVLSGYASIHSSSPAYSVFAPLQGALRFQNTPLAATLSTIFGIQSDVTILSTVDYVLLGLSGLILFTFGPVSAGTTYILRNMFRGEGIFLWHDFFHAIRRNWKQALGYGILDVMVMGLLAYDIFFFKLNYGMSWITDTMFFMTMGMAILYCIMRMYVYLMMVTFDLSIFKLLKNALFFTVLGLKRNVMALLGTIVVAALNYMLLVVFFPLGVILPFVLTLSLISLMWVYAAYPKIQEIMIDPYKKPSEEEEV